MIKLLCIGMAGAIVLLSGAAYAADYPAPKEADWIARDFKFHTGEVMPQLHLHYTTIGEATGQPVMILHGTGGSAKSLLKSQLPANCLAPARRSMRANISSSFPTRSATADRQNRPTACG